jgi:hypothetical protein
MPVRYKGQFQIKARSQTGKHTHALHGKLSPKPAAAPHNKSTHNDTISHLCSWQSQPHVQLSSGSCMGIMVDQEPHSESTVGFPVAQFQPVHEKTEKVQSTEPHRRAITSTPREAVSRTSRGTARQFDTEWHHESDMNACASVLEKRDTDHGSRSRCLGGSLAIR